MNDKEVICKNCNRIFVVRQAEQEFLSMRGRSVSEYCPICRQVYYAKKQEEQKQQENLEWQKKKEENARRYQEQLDLLQEQYSNVVSLKAVVPDPRDKVLYVIGNGFDLMHGAHSSYYDFEKMLGKHSYLRFILENYLEADDLWADFEGALAKINVEAMSQPYILNDLLEAMDAYDEDAQAADFFAAAEMAAAPFTELPRELRHRFERWIHSLQVRTEDRPLKDIIGSGKFLDFNYTEFIETLYGVCRGDVCYIHGRRKLTKADRKEQLILGHQPGASDSAYEFKEDWKGINLSGQRAQMIYDAQQVAMREIVEADSDLTKHCDKIINAHKSFFEDLTDIDKIITIGHSLYPVDWDYFSEVIEQNKDSAGMEWYFGCFNGDDLKRIQMFIQRFNIAWDRVHIFRTDTILVKLLPEKVSVPEKKQYAQEKIIGTSDGGHWNVWACGNRMDIRDDKGTVVLTRVFSREATGAVFADENTCFLVMRGVDKGVFLLRRIEGKWNYIGELMGIPNQGVITKRLHNILIDGERILFVYQSRVRVYALSDGTLVFNQAVRQAPSYEYKGKNLTDKFMKIYRNGFY